LSPGTNDAAALKQADVGVAFGNGSAVAIEAADLVLLEDLSAIVDGALLNGQADVHSYSPGVRLGRLVFENLRRTILYLLPAGSFSELWPVLVSVFFGLPQPLSSIQMILICCCTDLLPGLSMVLEQPGVS
jgi:sodium/potassium-transporting ATPase subunit alpha